MIAFVFISVFGLIFLGVPVAFAIIAAAILIFSVTGAQPLYVIASRVATGMDSFPLLAVPLFILVGNLMDKGGISKRLVNWAQSLVGFLPGSLGIVSIIACTIFAALTGSGPATVAAIGCIMIPSMVENGYPKRTATGMVCAAGALGPIIPPSIPMIIYGCTMGLSIPDMFVGGIIPGLMIAIALIIVNAVIVKRTPAIMQAPRPKFSLKVLLKNTWTALGALLLPVIVLGGIYSGVFTPTESAAVAVVYSLIVGLFVYKDLKFSDLRDIMLSSVQVSAMSIIITGAANVFSFILSNFKITDMIVPMLMQFVKNLPTYFVVLMLFLFVVGCLLDTVAAIIIIAPIMVPVGLQLGADPLHLGLVFVINLVLGYVTPPFGYNLFTAVSITDQRFEDVVKGSLPFLVVELVMLAAFCVFPELTTWLPSVIGG